MGSTDPIVATPDANSAIPAVSTGTAAPAALSPTAETVPAGESPKVVEGTPVLAEMPVMGAPPPAAVLEVAAKVAVEEEKKPKLTEEEAKAAPPTVEIPALAPTVQFDATPVPSGDPKATMKTPAPAPMGGSPNVTVVVKK